MFCLRSHSDGAQELTTNWFASCSVQFHPSVMSDSLQPMDCSTPDFPVHHQHPELAQTHVRQVGDAIQPSHPLSTPTPPTFNLSSIRLFSNESVLRIRWLKYWSFSFSISPSNKHPGLISFRMDWLDLLAVQGTLKSLLQHHSSKASTLWLSVFFIVQLSSIHDYWKNHSFEYTYLCWQSNISAF